MMNDVRTFRAANMQEALDLVREELGADAVILHTRQIPRRRLLPWQKTREQVEITAGLDVNVRTPAALRNAKPRPAAPRMPVRRATPPAASGNRMDSTPTGRILDLCSEPDESSVSRAFAADSATLPAPAGQSPPFGFHNRRPAPTVASPPVTAPERQTTSPLTGMNRPAAEAESTAELSKRLDSIQQILQKLGSTHRFGAAAEIPSELFNLYTDLIDADVEDELARELIFRLRENATPAQLQNAAAAKPLLAAMVESEIRCCGPILPVKGRRKVVALVGSTGVGKTTTIAKLAANFRLRDDVRMGLVTVDTYRIAAVEQLRTYAEIIDLPMKVVTSPLEMRRALDELAGLDLVLVDTAGRSPRDELQIQELKRLLAEAEVDDVHLVLSMTSSIRSLEATARKFAAVNVTSLILTKLDEAAGMGTLLSIARKIPVPVSYLTTGQDVPDDIEPAQVTRMSRLILGDEQIFG